jgi:hypothetical protein
MKICSKCSIEKEESEFYRNIKGSFRAAFKTCSKVHHAKYIASNGKDVRKAFDSNYYKSKKIREERQKIRELSHNRLKNIEYQRQYRRLYPEVSRFNRAKRRAAQLQRSPKWLTEEHIKQIDRYYFTAKWIQSILQVKIDVDHIMPLQGVNCSGLHVPWNLQLLTHEDNLKKGNK